MTHCVYCQTYERMGLSKCLGCLVAERKVFTTLAAIMHEIAWALLCRAQFEDGLNTDLGQIGTPCETCGSIMVNGPNDTLVCVNEHGRDHVDDWCEECYRRRAVCVCL